MAKAGSNSCEGRDLQTDTNAGFHSDLFDNHINEAAGNHYDGITEVAHSNPPSGLKAGEVINFTPPSLGHTLESRNAHESESDESSNLPNAQVNKFKNNNESPQNQDDETTITIRETKKPLIRMKVVSEDVDYSYERVSERIKKLFTSQSVDSESLKSNCTNSYSQKINNLSETKKLSMDPQFEQKIKELYSPSSGLSSSSGSNGSSNIRNGKKIDLYRLDSNCKVDEENLSPVSETARHLQQQLSFPSSPISPDRSPRIPKMSRFGRLNRLLDQASEPQLPISSSETSDANDLKS